MIMRNKLRTKEVFTDEYRSALQLVKKIFYICERRLRRNRNG